MEEAAMSGRVLVDLASAPSVSETRQADLIGLTGERPTEVLEAAWDMVELDPDRVLDVGRLMWGALDTVRQAEGDGWAWAFTLISVLGREVGLSLRDTAKLVLVAAQRVAERL